MTKRNFCSIKFFIFTLLLNYNEIKSLKMGSNVPNNVNYLAYD